MKDPKPMRAVKLDDLDLTKLTYPVYAQPKFDGIRCIIKDGVALSNTLKPVRNEYVQKMASQLSDGFDGELISGNNFQETSSNIMSSGGDSNFTYYIFDLWNSPDPYRTRRSVLESLFIIQGSVPNIVLVQDFLCKTQERLQSFEEQILHQGHEGIMLRQVYGLYKFGRSTLKEQYLMKRKPFIDDDAFIIGFEEQKENQNEQTVDGRGYSLRSSHAENKFGKNTLGAFIVRNTRFGEFRIGTGQGLTDSLRQEIWDNKLKYENQIITFKYQKHGTKDLPRTPIFLRFRHADDCLVEL
jgi:DNA ligase-1